VSVLAIVPARAGSKRLPRKNIRPLSGVPLIGWTLRAASAAGCIDRILVSTDDEQIARVACEYGGEVPWLRDPELATDAASSVEVVLEVLDRVRAEGAPDPQTVLLLQPTSPFRTIDTIRRLVVAHTAAFGESVVTVSPAQTHPYWCKTVGEDGVLHPFFDHAPAILPRSQDLPSVFELNGVGYAATPAVLRQGDFFSAATRALVIDDPVEALDIDTAFDWEVAMTFAESRR
jgi:CMP-N,N'-diacetyllegionaminic acid synthase